MKEYDLKQLKKMSVQIEECDLSLCNLRGPLRGDVPMTDDEHPAVVVLVELFEGIRPCVGGVVEGFVCDRSVHLTNNVSTINQHCQYN